MSDTSGADWLTGAGDDRPTATGTIVDTDIEITVVEVTSAQLDALDGSVENGTADEEAMDNGIREFLVDVGGDEPPDPDEMLLRRKNLLWMSMMNIWSGAEDILPAMQEMSLPEGNG
jgi:hypothetical protein